MSGRPTMKDFILVSEFCEVYGPRSVFTVPSLLPHPNNNDHFNLDEFLLYIMTTDYQNFAGEKLEEKSDVPCIRTNIIQDFHAVLHYFTLKDPQARGGVRPSCIAYVTQSQTKLYRLRMDILQVLNMSAQLFKHANIRWMKHLGLTVNIQEKRVIVDLLEKWSHLSIEPAETTGPEKKLRPWNELCPIGISVVIFGLLRVYKILSRPLEDQILDPKEVCVSYELFDSVVADDADMKAVISQLNCVVIN